MLPSFHYDTLSSLSSHRMVLVIFIATRTTSFVCLLIYDDNILVFRQYTSLGQATAMAWHSVQAYCKSAFGIARNVKPGLKAGYHLMK